MGAAPTQTTLRQLKDLICRAPDPAADRGALLALREAGPAARQLAERMHTEAVWRREPLQDLLPGLSILESTAFRRRLGDRVAKPLVRAGIDSWFGLAASTPSALLAISGIGTEALEEILQAATAEWAAAYLHAAEGGRREAAVARSSSSGRPRPKQLLDLIFEAPDPVADHDLLVVLSDHNNRDTQWLAGALHTETEFKHAPLRLLLPGLGLVESPTFSTRFSVRAVNCLGRASASTLAGLARLTPAAILAQPDVGVKTVEEVLVATVAEWASSYVAVGDRKRAETQSSTRAAPSAREPAQVAQSDLDEAFARLEEIPAFDIFRRRYLDPNSSPSQVQIADELGVSEARVSRQLQKFRGLLQREARDDESPVAAAADSLREGLGALARPVELEEALAALDPAGTVISDDVPHRRALLLQAADFRLSGDWVVDVEFETVAQAMLNGLTEAKPVDLDVVERCLARLGVAESLRLPWISGLAGFRIVNGKLIRRHD